jgi:hypothetical protein
VFSWNSEDADFTRLKKRSGGLARLKLAFRT